MTVASRRTAVVIVALAVLVVSVIPIPGSVPDDGGGIPTSVLFHFLGYAVLAALLAFSMFVGETFVRAGPVGVFGASAYGVLIECVQYPIPYRTFSYLDMFVNAAGAVAGVLVLISVLALSDDHR